MIKELFKHKTATREGCKFTYDQVFFNGKLYIYEVSYYGSNKPWYEVFKRKLVPNIKNVDGKLVRTDDEHVKYPPNEAFGKWAWCCHDVECVIKALAENKDALEGCTEGITEWLYNAI